LRWQDVHADAGLIRLRQQVQHIQAEPHLGPVKTRARNRDLPLTALAQDALSAPAHDRRGAVRQRPRRHRAHRRHDRARALMPAAMALFGERNWYLPGWLAWRLRPA